MATNQWHDAIVNRKPIGPGGMPGVAGNTWHDAVTGSSPKMQPLGTQPKTSPNQPTQAKQATLQGPKQMTGANFQDFPRLVQQMGQQGQDPRANYHAYLSNIMSWLQQIFAEIGGSPASQGTFWAGNKGQATTPEVKT